MKKLKMYPIFKHQSGQSLVELAISLTVILMLLSGAVDFGMAFFTYTALRDAAQEGALYGSFNPDPASLSDIEDRVRNSSTNPVNLADTSKVHVVISWTNGPSAACQGSVGGITNGIKVSVSYNYPIIMPFLGTIIGSQTIPLNATVTDTILSPMCS
jgi:Flp pilus assembly protein TadG